MNEQQLLQSLSEKFKSFLNDTKPNMGYQEIMELFFKYYTYSSVPILIPPKSKDTTIEIFRLTPPYKDMNIEKANSYSHPPKELTKLGRANIINEPVFYGSESFLTTIQEMKDKLELNSIYYLSKWRLALDQIYTIPIILNDITDQPNQALNGLSKGVKELSQYLISEYDLETGRLIRDIGNLFSLRGNKYYYITGAFSHYYLSSDFTKKIKKPPLLLYPSVERRSSALNMAIPKHIVSDRNLFQLDTVYEIKVLENNIPKANNITTKLLRRAKLKEDVFQGWESIRLSLKKVHFEDLEIRLYNSEVIKGEEISLKLFDSIIPTRDVVYNLIKQHINRYGLPEDIVFSHSDSLISDGAISSFNLLCCFDHGLKYPVKNSYSCIQCIRVPVDIEVNFQK